MTPLSFHLRRHPVSLPVTAGWLPSPNVRDWLLEARSLLDANPGAEVRFFPVANLPPGSGVAGAVITVEGTRDHSALDRCLSPRVTRLGNASPRVLIPADTRLLPEWTAPEERAFFPWDLQFFHPSLGMTGFAESDGLAPERLIAASVTERDGWRAAVPGPQAPPPLRGAVLVQEVSVADLLREEAGEIGAAAEPAGPAENLREAVEKAGKTAGSLLGAAAGKLLRVFGGRAAADRMQNWSRRQWEQVKSRRDRELQRLLRRFEKDTLDALRHAIPLTGTEARRGPAPPPGSRLSVRSLDFRPMGSAAGGDTWDTWEIDRDMRLALERRYREAAATEAAVGNFARAAYIYGELLGDWNQAAAMLEQAGRARDAAWIFRHRLNSLPRAAACLETGGFLEEAAELYQLATLSEKAGDMMARLGRMEEARVLWREAASRLSHPLELAKLLETKLAAPEEALTALRKGWPASSHAEACFSRHFYLLGKLGRNAEAGTLLEWLESTPSGRLNPAHVMVSGLLMVAREYPDAGVRDRAKDLALTVTGEHLAREPRGNSAKALLRMAAALAPGDRLLDADCERFSVTRNRPAPPHRTRSGATAPPARAVLLDRDHHWQALFAWGRDLSVSGWRPSSSSFSRKDLVYSRIHDGRVVDWIKEPCPWVSEGSLRVSHFVRGTAEKILVFLARGENTALWRKARGAVHVRSVLAAGPGSDPAEFLLLRITETGSLAVETRGPDGNLRRTRVLDSAPPAMAKCECFIGANREDLWIAGPDVACCVTSEGMFQSAQLAATPVAMAVAPLSLPSQAMVVAGMEVVLLLPRGKKGLECVNLFTFSSGIPPVAAFTADGRAVVAGVGGALIYGLRDGIEMEGKAEFPPGSGHPLAAAPAGTAGFAFLMSEGMVLIYDAE